jgi:2'-5' RNA ligase
VRLFVGIAIDELVLNAAVRQWIVASGMRATLDQNLHITLKFIGAWSDTRLTEVTDALRNLTGHAMEIRIGGFGRLPEMGAAKTFWVGVNGGAALVALAESIDTRLAGLGVPLETRPYRPHVTLARAGRNAAAVRTDRAELPLTTELGTLVATEFHLYESASQQGFSLYRRLATFPLQKPVH